MEKQSTSKFLRSVIAVVALFMLVVSGVLLASCKEEHVHTEPNDFGACESCGSIIDWDVYESKLSGLLAPSFEDLTTSLTDLADEVTEVKGDVDAIVGALNVAGEGSDIDTIVNNVQKVLDQITALIGAENVAARATPATITGIASAITGVQQTLDATKAGSIIEHVCDQHVFDTNTPIVEIDPSCERAGAVVYRCSNCNATIALPINQLNHEPAEQPVKENVEEPSCTEAGSYDLVYYCKNGCNEPLSTTHVDVPAKGHDWDTENPVTMTAPTCTEVGSAVYNCKNCDAQSESIEIPANGHTYDWTTPVAEETVDPNCTEDGYAVFVCTVCQAKLTLKPTDEKPESMTDEQWTAFQAVYKATGHNFTNEDGSESFVWKYGDDIDFSENEITATKYLVCTDCGHEEAAKGTDGQPVTEQQTHLWAIDTVKTEAQSNIKKLEEGAEGYGESYYGYVNTSCQASAYVYWICDDSNCKTHADDFGFPIKVELKPADHEWKADPAKPNILPTCETEGHNYWICDIGKEAWDEVVPAKGHSWDKDTVIEEKLPTCTEDGYRTYKCTVCSKTTTDTLEALGHALVDNTTYERIDSTTHKVITTTTCSRENCDYKEVVEKIENHYEGESMLNPTSKDEAEEIAEKYELEIYEKDGKYYFTDAGCDRSGFIMNVCACGHVVRDWESYVPALKHDWSEGVYIEGSCVTAGKIQYTCERCGEIYIETVQTATGHTWAETTVAPKAPTCTEAGTKGYLECTVCGEIVAWDGEETISDFTTDYVDYEAEGYDSAADWAYIAPTGHVFDKTFIIRDLYGCESPVWQITVCSACLDQSVDGKIFVIEKDPDGFTQDETTYIATDLSAAEGYEFEEGKDLAWYINDLLEGLNFLDSNGFTADMIKDGTVIKGWNITGITFVPAAGHELNKTQSDEKTDAIVCLTDKALDSYADALAFAEKVYGPVDETEFKAAFDEIFGTNDTTREAFEIDVTGAETPTLAGICTECGMPVETVPHDEQYYMFELGYDAGTLSEPKYTPYDYTVALKGVGEDGVDVNKVIVNTQKYLVKDAEGNMLYADEKAITDNKYTKVVFTLDEIISMGYYNMDANNEFLAVNCYFEGFCARDCGTDLGHKNEHTFPTSDDYDKYHNCMHGDICVWCTQLMRNADEHNLQNLEEISAYGGRYAAAVDKLYNSGFEWVGKDTVGEVDCKTDGYDYTITVCVSCLLAWAEEDPNFEDWTENVNYTSERETAKGDHEFVLVKSGDPNSKNCLVGYFETYVCEVCGYQLKHTDTFDYAEEEIESLNDDDYVEDTYLPTKLHTVAPVAGYWLNDNYEAATDADPAYMNYICVDCGARLQGYYDGVNDAGEVVYTMATETEISEYLATVGSDDDKVAKWGNIQVVRPVDKAAVETVEFAAGATEADKVAAVAKAIADAEEEKATSVYLTIPGDFTIGASDTTTFAEGETTVWQAYGITFSEESSVKKIVIDLGGNKLTFGQNASYTINGEGTVVFSNGDIKANNVGQGSFFLMGYQSAIVFDHVDIETSGVIGFGNNEEPKTALGSIVITNSTIKSSGYFGFSTNASDWQNSEVNITIENSTISVGSVVAEAAGVDNCAVMMNVPGTFTLKNSTINADRQGIILRGGDIKATIENTTINLSGKYATKDLYLTTAWGSGNEVPMGGIVLGDGDGNNTVYTPGLATVALNNVTVNVDAEDVAKVYVYATAADVQVDLTITNADAEAPTLVAADVVNGSAVADADVYELTVDGTVCVPAPAAEVEPEQPQA